jgi:hypothetical protein
MQKTSISGTKVQSKVRKRGEKSNNTENMRLKTKTGLGLQGRGLGKVSE